MEDSDQLEARSGLAQARSFLWLAAGAALLVGGAVFVSQNKPATTAASSYARAFGGSFALTAPDGSPVTDQTLAGKPYAIFFGFTRCPDVCPTTLARMTRLRQQLGADGKKFNIVFVSVDPGRDKPADIGRYVALFGTPILGLTGTEAQIARIKRGFGVFSAQVPLPGGDYTVDHTAAVYLMTAKGEFSGTIDHHEADQTALAKLKLLIS